MPDPILKATFAGAEGVGRLSWSPEGARFAAPLQSGAVLVVSIEPSVQVLAVGHTARAIAVAWSPDGRHIVSSSDDGTLRTWIAPPIGGTEIHPRSDIQLGSAAAGLLWSTNGILAGDNRGYLSHVGTADGVLNPPARVASLSGAIAAIAPALQEPLVAIALQDSDHIVLLNPAHGNTIHHRVPFGGTRIYAVQWARSPQPFGTIYAGLSDGVIKRWSRNGRAAAVHHAADVPVVSITISDDERLLAYKAHDGVVRILDTHTWTPVASLSDPRSTLMVTGISFRPRTHDLLTLGDDGTMRLWDLKAVTASLQRPDSVREPPLRAHHQVGSQFALRWNGPDRPFLRADDYGKCIAEVLREATGEVTLSVLGHWGRGKTFLTRLIVRHLESTHEVVWFSAWRYRARPELWAHLHESFRDAAHQTSRLASIARDVRAGIHRNGTLNLTFGITCIALALVPLGSLLAIALPFLGLVGGARLLWAFGKGKQSISAIATQYLSGNSHRERLGVQAAIGDDLRALILGWLLPLKLRWWPALFYALSAFLLTISLHVGLTPQADSMLPKSVFGYRPQYYPPQEFTLGLVVLVGLAAVVVPFGVAFLGQGKQRILLVVDDLDRLACGEMLDVLEAIKLLLEDPRLHQHVQVVALYEEQAFKTAVSQRYAHLAPRSPEAESGELLRIVEETQQKLFMASVRLPPLTKRERREVLASLLDMKPPTEADVIQAEAARDERLRELTQSPTSTPLGPLILAERDPTAQALTIRASALNRRLVESAPADAPSPAVVEEASVLSSEEKEALLASLHELTSVKAAAIGPRSIQSFVFRYQIARSLMKARKCRVPPKTLATSLARRLAGATDVRPSEMYDLPGNIEFELASVLDEVC